MNVKSYIALLIVFHINILSAQSIQHPWHVIDRGGGKSTASGVILQASIGQPAIQFMSASSTTLESGYIPGLRGYSGIATATSQSLANGWNLLSVPLAVNDYRKTTLYPNAVSSAFIYQGSYEHRDTLRNGEGFWVKFGSPGSVLIGGAALEAESVAVSAGWNLIGPPSYPFPVSHIVSPGTNVLSSYFGYSSSYFVEDTLEPGFGYWVRVSSPGKLVFNSGSGVNGPSCLQTVTKSAENQTTEISSALKSIGDLSILRLADVEGKTAKLYFLTSPTELDPKMSELPPPAPEGSAEVRFSTNHLVEVADRSLSKTIPIVVRGMKPPLTVRWEIMAVSSSSALLLLDGKSIMMKGRGEARISNPETPLKLILQPPEGIELPKEFALRQNFPNPFNPTATIPYQLPSESRITLRIFNILGQLVETLNDDIEQAGYKSVNWNASSFASGIYFYQLEATSVANPSKTFTQVRKMCLVR